MTKRLLPLLLLPLLSSPVAASTLYRCADEHGQVLYTNQKSTGRNCSVLSQSPVASAAAPAGGQRAAQVRAPTPADFPRVGNDQQKARDTDRRAILEQELAVEQKNLDEARTQGGQDKMRLHERNIEALKKELANLK